MVPYLSPLFTSYDAKIRSHYCLVEWYFFALTTNEHVFGFCPTCGFLIQKPCVEKFKISLVPQIGGYFSDLSTEDNLNAVGEILIMDPKLRKMKVEELIFKFELDAVRNCLLYTSDAADE